MFVDGYKQLNIIKNCANFVRKIEELKSYIVKFNQNGVIKPKIYFFNCAVKRENCQPVAIII